MDGVSAGVRGDWAALDALVTRLNTVDKARVAATKRIAHEAERRVAAGFNRSHEPDGTPWKPLKRPTARARKGVPRDAVGRFAASRGPRPGRPLIKTRALYLSVQQSYLTPLGFVIETALPYAATHQYGRGPIPARPFLPLDGLPASWEAAFREVGGAAIEQHFR